MCVHICLCVNIHICVCMFGFCTCIYLMHVCCTSCAYMLIHYMSVWRRVCMWALCVGYIIILCLYLYLCLHFRVSKYVGGCASIHVCVDLCMSVCMSGYCVLPPSSQLSPWYDSLFLLPFLSVLHNSLISVRLVSWAASSFPVFLYFNIHPRSSS